MKDLKLNLLRYSQREQLKAEIAQADQSLSQAKSEDAGTIRASRNKTQKQLDEGSPVPLTGKEKDTLNALEKKLRARITTNMPTEETMRKNPAGAVDHHTKWERANKSLIRMWKNVKIQLNPENQDRDLCNIDKYRPSGQTDRMRTDAQIPGLMSFGTVPQENWDQIFDAPTNTALEQAKRREYEESDAQHEVNTAIDALDEQEIDQAEEESKDQCSPEQHAILVTRLQKAREVLAQKRAEAKKLNADLEEKDLVADPA